MSGTNPSGVFNGYPQGPLPVPSGTVFLAAGSTSPGAPMYIYLASQIGGGTGTTVQVGITATGTTQGTAYALTATNSVVTSAPSGTGVRLPAAAGVFTVQNVDTNSAHALKVYPSGSGQVNGGGAAVAFIMGANYAKISFTSADGITWYAG
jgi:hypothetical protein